MHQTRSGFTIVELLIVIVVIAVLATISLISYSGIQARAEDSRRISDLKAIAKALELYKVDNGNYPALSASGLGLQQGWETSAREASGQFLAPIKVFGFSSGIPVDPVNDAVEATGAETRTNKTYGYYYAKYGAGSYSCDINKGAFYVLAAINTKMAGGAKHPDSPGFSCAGRNWQGEFSWVTGEYEN